MKTWKWLALALLCTVMTACGGTNPAPNPTPTPTPTPGNGFDFSLSSSTLSIARGETKTLSFTVTRPNGFQGEVLLTFTDMPAGVAGAGLAETGKTSGELFVMADTSATVGTVTVKVVAQGVTRDEALIKEQTLTITVTAQSSPGEEEDVFSKAPNPLDVLVTLDGARKVSKTIGAQGGSLSVTATDGAAFTLTVPAGALLGNVELSMTPLTGIDHLPLSGGLLAGVHLEPHGLTLLEPAMLTITPATTPTSGELIAFNAHKMGAEFYFQPHAMQGSGVTLYLSHFSNPGVGTGDLSDLLTPLVPTAPGDRFENAIARPDANLSLLVGKFYLVTKSRLEVARSDAALLQSAIQDFLTWRKEVTRAGLDEQFKKEIYEGWTLIAQGIENAVNEAAASCANDADLNQLGEMLYWVSWVKSNPRLQPYFAGKLEAFEAKVVACASFELEFESKLKIRTFTPHPTGEPYNISDITSDYVVSALVPVQYNPERGILEGNGDMSYDAWTTSGFTGYWGPHTETDCPNVTRGTLTSLDIPFSVDEDFYHQSAIDFVLTDLTTGRPVPTISLVMYPGFLEQLFHLSCRHGNMEANSVDGHMDWLTHFTNLHGFGGLDMSWWHVGGLLFTNGVAETIIPVSYNGRNPAMPKDAGSDHQLAAEGSTRLTLRHKPH